MKTTATWWIHTAVGVDVYEKYVICTGDITKTLIAATASPFKFNRSVAAAIFGEDEIAGYDEFELLEALSRHCGLAVPAGLAGFRESRSCTKGSAAGKG